MVKIILLAITMISITSCSVEQKEIDFGNVHCHHCDMTVVDKSHAAEYVTKKGKAYFFDATECLVMNINQEKNESEMAFILVSDFEKPGELIDAKTANYVISDAIKSPMGANLSAYASIEEAGEFVNENGGKLYNWTELKTQLSN